MGRERLEARLSRLRERLAERNLDGLIVSQPPNVRYLTGFSGTSGVVLVRPSDVVLVTDFRYETQATAQVEGLARVEIVKRDPIGRVLEFLRRSRPALRVGYDGAGMTADEADRLLGERPRLQLESASGVVEALREAKDDEEIAALRAAADLACGALESVLEQVRPGLRECDVAGELERALRRGGSEWHPFPTIVASGPRSALPHAQTSAREIERGEWLLLDFGAQVEGYCADITRTVVVGGAPDERQRMIYDLVRDAHDHCIAHMRDGMTGAEIDQLARSVIEARGFGHGFGHALGHGLGLEVHEAPRLGPSSDTPIPVQAVVTVEPGIYVPGWGGVRIEDDVLVGPDGAEVLSDGRVELREVGC